MNSEEDTPSLLWLQRGDEGYGVASTIIAFSLALSKQGWHVSVLCIDGGEFENRLNAAGVKVRTLGLPLPPRSVGGNPFRRALLLVHTALWARRTKHRVRAEVARPGPTVVQTMNVLLLDTLGSLCENRRSLAIWRMGNGVTPRRSAFIARWFVRMKCDLWGIVNLANSKWTERSLQRDSDKSRTLLHGCNSRRFDPNHVVARRRQDLGISEDAIVFAIVARLVKNGSKGQLDALRGLSRYIQRFPLRTDVSLLLIGGSTDDPNPLIDSIFEFEPAPGLRVHHVGMVEDVESFYPLVDVAINARRDAEPFGLSVVEAMMMGVPVLAHALGGPVETVSDGHTGWLVEDNSIEGWSNAFARVVADRPKWQAMSRAARASALSRFTIEVEVEKWLEIIAEIRTTTHHNLEQPHEIGLDDG